MPTVASALTATRCDALLKSLFSNTVDANAVAAACSPTVTWNDMSLKEPLVGPSAVAEHLESLHPPGSKLVIERCADGEQKSGFCWHREADGVDGMGLRGITYVELDDAGLQRPLALAPVRAPLRALGRTRVRDPAAGFDHLKW